MGAFSDKAKIVSEEFARANSLRFTLIAMDEIALTGDGFYLFFSVDREGVDMSYVDCGQRLSFVLGVFLFVCRKARVAPFDPASGVVPDNSFELSQLLKMLSGWGKDILAGSRSWIEEYPWPPRSLVATEISAQFRYSLGIPVNPDFAKLDDAIRVALPLLRRRVIEHPTFYAYQHAIAQISYMQPFLDSQTVPSGEDRSRVTLGIMCVKTIEAIDMEMADLLYGVCYSFDKLGTTQ